MTTPDVGDISGRVSPSVPFPPRQDRLMPRSSTAVVSTRRSPWGFAAARPTRGCSTDEGRLDDGSVYRTGGVGLGRRKPQHDCRR
jgi:hypothetical protein